MNRSAREDKSVKRFERSNGLDIALYKKTTFKNYLLVALTQSHVKLSIFVFLIPVVPRLIHVVPSLIPVIFRIIPVVLRLIPVISRIIPVVPCLILVVPL